MLNKALVGSFYIRKIYLVPFKMVQLRAFFSADLRSWDRSIGLIAGFAQAQRQLFSGLI